MRLAGENGRNVAITYEARRSIQVLLNLRKHSKGGHSPQPHQDKQQKPCALQRSAKSAAAGGRA
jgi:hypothetical protein